jgi:hypothetical protein
LGEIAKRGLAFCFSAKRWCFMQILARLHRHLSAKN